MATDEFTARLVKENAQLKAHVESLEEESRQWEKASLVKLIKERDQLKAELVKCEKEGNRCKLIAIRLNRDLEQATQREARLRGGDRRCN